MTTGFPALICFAGSIVLFAFSIRLRRLRPPEKAPASGAIGSLEERQKKAQLASRLCFALGAVTLAGAIFLELRGLRS
jgi:hypothetical protein